MKNRNRMRRRSSSVVRFVAVTLIIGVSRLLAVGTSHWIHTTAADFSGGKLDNVVATSLGELKLSRATKTILNQDARVSAVYALAEAKDGGIYAATGPQGVVLRMKDGKSETAATLGDDVSCFSMLIDRDDRVLVGTGGEAGKIFRVDKPGDKPAEIFSAPGVQYVWSIVETPDRNLYAATGPNGQLFEIHPDGTNKVLFSSDENNLLSLVGDGGDLLYIGSDPNGHVYRVNRKTGEVFVVFDASETEISALAIDSRGVVYAGTGQSTGQETSPTEPPIESKGGRPEIENDKTVPLPSQPEPAAPEPPKIPLPGPGDPQPIPKNAPASTTHPLNMLIDVPATKATKSAATAQQEDPGDGPADPMPAPAKKPRRKPPLAGAIQQAGAAPSAPVVPGRGGEPPAEGNAIYRIDKDGFVTEIFREPVLVLSIYENNGTLLVATGGEGRVYQINPAAEESATIAKLDPKEALCLLPSKSGDIFIGLANDGQIATLSAGYADHGTFVSSVLDAAQISRFGKMHLHGTLPTDTSLTVSTRSGNVADPAEVGWSSWSEEVPASQYLEIKSAAARFLQYRLSFSTKDTKKTAVVDEVNVAYQMPNRAPVIKSVTVSSPAIDAKKEIQGKSQQAAPSANAAMPSIEPKPEASSQVTLAWEASDPNSDTLQYTVYYRLASSSETPWILLKEKLVEATFEWNTRSVADGRYEIKVVASDALANPLGEGKSASRVSEAVEVDNTPPVIGDLKVESADGGVKLSTRVVDRTSTVANLEYSVDSSTDWQAVLPSDTIADSPQETYAFTVGGLSAGAHQISLRATDDHGNQRYETVTATVGK